MSRFHVRRATPRELASLGDFLAFKLQRDAVGLSAVDSKGSVRGVVALDGFGDGEAFGHQAFVPAAVRVLAPAFFHLAFLALGLKRVRGLVRAGNTRSLHLALRLGFVEEKRVKDGWAEGEDSVFLTLPREACRWLGKERKAA